MVERITTTIELTQCERVGDQLGVHVCEHSHDADMIRAWNERAERTDRALFSGWDRSSGFLIYWDREKNQTSGK